MSNNCSFWEALSAIGTILAVIIALRIPEWWYEVNNQPSIKIISEKSIDKLNEKPGDYRVNKKVIFDIIISNEHQIPAKSILLQYFKINYDEKEEGFEKMIELETSSLPY